LNGVEPGQLRTQGRPAVERRPALERGAPTWSHGLPCPGSLTPSRGLACNAALACRCLGATEEGRADRSPWLRERRPAGELPGSLTWSRGLACSAALTCAQIERPGFGIAEGHELHGCAGSGSGTAQLVRPPIGSGPRRVAKQSGWWEG
jgi:hypothetical protein